MVSSVWLLWLGLCLGACDMGVLDVYLLVGFVCLVGRWLVLSVRLRDTGWCESRVWLYVCEGILFGGLWFFVAVYGLWVMLVGSVVFDWVFNENG